jgi:cytochrome c oxidase assembly protein subunit 11
MKPTPQRESENAQFNGGSKRLRRRNAVVVGAAISIMLAMTALVSYSVPLYRLFCQVTGYGGTTQIAQQAPAQAAGRIVTVRFDANIAPEMPWKFTAPAPVQVRLGEQKVVSYTATNLGSEPVLGTATYNVTPFKAGAYFDKIQCFCFTEQLLMPGERKDFTVTFFVDPKIAEDRDTNDVTTITLSYTFFNKGAAARDEYLREHKIALGQTASHDR